MPVASMVGALTTLQSAVATALPGASVELSAARNVYVEVSGTFTNITANWEASIDGSTYFAIGLEVMGTVPIVNALTAAAPGLYRLAACSGLTHLRARTTVGAATGTMTVRASAG